jgi:hypothetical protein
MSGSRETAPCSMLHPAIQSPQSPLLHTSYFGRSGLSRVRAEPRSNINCHGRCRYRCLDISSVGACIGHWDSEMSGKSCGSGRKHIVSQRATCTNVRRIGFSFAAHQSSQRMYWPRGFQEPDSCTGTSSVKLAQRPSRRPRTPSGWKYGKRGD